MVRDIYGLANTVRLGKSSRYGYCLHSVSPVKVAFKNWLNTDDSIKLCRFDVTSRNVVARS